MAKILIIDDAKHVWKLLEFLFKKGQHDPIWAEDGLKAMEIMEQDKPDLIISDVMLPYMNGLQILQKVKSDDELKSIPFIILSSKVQKNDVQKGLALGADDYICKPFSTDALLSKVNEILKLNDQKQISHQV